MQNYVFVGFRRPGKSYLMYQQIHHLMEQGHSIDEILYFKYYFIDNGILNLFLIEPATSLLENQVGIRLRQLYGDQVYFYHKGIEVDFVVFDERLAFQVSYSLADPETEKREMDALLKLNKVLPMRKLLIPICKCLL